MSQRDSKNTNANEKKKKKKKMPVQLLSDQYARFSKVVKTTI